jgi:hypothetical protein
MPEDHRTMSVERLLADGAVDRELAGAPISRRSRQTARSLDAYLKAGGRPRWMERLSEIEGRTAMEKRRLERLHRALEEECGRGTALFAARWRAFAAQYRFDAINELIRQHNDWYPIERDLAMDPRTRDFVLIHGRSYRRTELGPEWILERFPASPPDAD